MTSASNTIGAAALQVRRVVIAGRRRRRRLHKLDAVAASGGVLLRLEVVDGQPKLAQDGVAKPLQRVCSPK